MTETWAEMEFRNLDLGDERLNLKFPSFLRQEILVGANFRKILDLTNIPRRETKIISLKTTACW